MKITEVADKLIEVTPVSGTPCVYLSGGLDSSIVLHCLRQKHAGRILCLTAVFGDDQEDRDEVDRAKRVSEHYGTEWEPVYVSNPVDRIRLLQKHFSHPRYNIWPDYLAERAEKHGCDAAYIGEGSDELFGYADRPYHDGWAGHLTWIVPTYQTLNRLHGLETVMPFRNLDWQEMLPFLKPPTKECLREAFRGRVADWILEIPKSAPRFTIYWRIWLGTLRYAYPQFRVKDEADIKAILQWIACGAWVESFTGRGIG